MKMLWKAIALASAFFSYGKSADDYWIGDSYPVSLKNATVIKADYVNIDLVYKPENSSNTSWESWPSWRVATDVANNGTTYTIGDDLSSSTGQLFIPSNTTGYFIATADNDTNVTTEADLTGPITIYQTVTMSSTSGRAWEAHVTDLPTHITVFVQVRRETYYHMAEHNWTAILISLTDDGESWQSARKLEAHITGTPTPSPTMDPTMLPTTAISTTSISTTSISTTSNGTISTTSNGTISTTSNGTTSTTSTTPTPTTPTPTTPTPTTPTPTTPTPTTPTPTTPTPTTPTPTTPTPTTPTPTTPTPTTPTPTTPTPTKPARRLLGFYDAYGYVYGDEAGATCTRLGSLYCEFNITVNLPEDTQSGGPFILNVGVKDGNPSYQYYTINNPENYNVLKNQFIVYNDTGLSVNATKNGTITDRFTKYENIGLNVSVVDELKDIDVFVALQSVGSNDEKYYLDCKAQKPSEFSKFGWKTWNADETNVTLPYDEYYFLLYWAASFEHFGELVKSNDSDLFELKFGLSSVDIFYNWPEVNDSNETIEGIIDPVSISTTSFELGNKHSIKFTTAFNYTTQLYGYIEQCNTTVNHTTCHDFTNDTFNFTYMEEVTAYDVFFPVTLTKTTTGKSGNISTYLHVYTYTCDGEPGLNSTIELTINKASSKKKTKGLSAGAIVGIVCAGVLICGLAAWWLCMKRSRGDGYQTLEE